MLTKFIAVFLILFPILGAWCSEVARTSGEPFGLPSISQSRRLDVNSATAFVQGNVLIKKAKSWAQNALTKLPKRDLAFVSVPANFGEVIADVAVRGHGARSKEAINRHVKTLDMVTKLSNLYQSASAVGAGLQNLQRQFSTSSPAPLPWQIPQSQWKTQQPSWQTPQSSLPTPKSSRLPWQLPWSSVTPTMLAQSRAPVQLPWATGGSKSAFPVFGAPSNAHEVAGPGQEYAPYQSDSTQNDPRGNGFFQGITQAMTDRMDKSRKDFSNGMSQAGHATSQAFKFAGDASVKLQPLMLRAQQTLAGKADQEEALANYTLAATPEEQWVYIQSARGTGSELWGSMNPNLRLTSNVTGCELQATPPKYWPEEVASEYFGNRNSFGLLRDPYDRLTHAFRTKAASFMEGRLQAESTMYSTCDVNAWIKSELREYQNGDRFRDHCNLLPQAEFFESPHGITDPIDTQGLPKSFNEMMQKHGYAFRWKTETFTPSSACRNVSAYSLDETSKALIKDVYAQDFALACDHFGHCDRDEVTCLAQMPDMCGESVMKQVVDKSVQEDKVEYIDVDGDLNSFTLNKFGRLDYYVKGSQKVHDLAALDTETNGLTLHIDGSSSGSWSSAWTSTVPEGQEALVQRIEALFKRSVERRPDGI